LLAVARAAVPAGVSEDVPFLLHGEDAGASPVLRLARREDLQTRVGLEDVLTGPDGSVSPGTRTSSGRRGRWRRPREGRDLLPSAVARLFLRYPEETLSIRPVS
jgi:hypothetical protein